MSEEWNDLKKRKSWKEGLDQSFVDWFWGIAFMLMWLIPLMAWSYLMQGHL